MGLPETGDVIIDINSQPHIITRWGKKKLITIRVSSKFEFQVCTTWTTELYFIYLTQIMYLGCIKYCQFIFSISFFEVEK